jgi:hypothetical protein
VRYAPRVADEHDADAALACVAEELEQRLSGKARR